MIIYIMNFHKSYSKTDLLDLINTLDIPIVFSHQDNKSTIHKKFKDYFNSNPMDKYKTSFYNIGDTKELQVFLSKPNPKKSMTIKEKSDIMRIAKFIIQYCKNGYMLSISPHYSTYQEIIDDMLYITQYGDIPSVRRCCRLLEKDFNIKRTFSPIISPQIQKQIDDKKKAKGSMELKYTLKKGHFVVVFE
jgi:hypothetical protein